MSIVRTRVLAVLAGLLILIAGVATAQRPRQNVSGARHPNIAAAQQLSREAWQRIIAAQKANEWDMDGHAQRAKNLLDDVNRELKLAAGAANRNPR